MSIFHFWILGSPLENRYPLNQESHLTFAPKHSGTSRTKAIWENLCYVSHATLPNLPHADLADLILEVMTYRLLEGGHDVMGEINVLEHSFQLCGELTSAFSLQFCDHCLFCIIACAPSQKQSLGQVLLVESFKDILALKDSPSYTKSDK